jgi:hypothetical protein
LRGVRGLLEFPSCTLWFDEEGVRRGECSDCGECCIYIFLPEFGKKFREEGCPYKEAHGD